MWTECIEACGPPPQGEEARHELRCSFLHVKAPPVGRSWARDPFGAGSRTLDAPMASSLFQVTAELDEAAARRRSSPSLHPIRPAFARQGDRRPYGHTAEVGPWTIGPVGRQVMTVADPTAPAVLVIDLVDQDRLDLSAVGCFCSGCPGGALGAVPGPWFRPPPDRRHSGHAVEFRGRSCLPAPLGI